MYWEIISHLCSKNRIDRRIISSNWCKIRENMYCIFLMLMLLLFCVVLRYHYKEMMWSREGRCWWLCGGECQTVEKNWGNRRIFLLFHKSKWTSSHINWLQDGLKNERGRCHTTSAFSYSSSCVFFFWRLIFNNLPKNNNELGFNYRCKYLMITRIFNK